MSFRNALRAMAAATATLAVDPSNADTEHPNVVQLIFDGISVNSITYAGAVEVTSGQPYTLPITIESTGSGANTTWDITLDAGRSKSTPIATDFINEAQATSGRTARLSMTPLNQLNFFFDLSIQVYVGNDLAAPFALYLGQGSTFERHSADGRPCGSLGGRAPPPALERAGDGA